MSLNLVLNVDGFDIPLYQTPSWVAKICAMQPDGNYLGEIKGVDNIERALCCYEVWLKDSSSDRFENNGEYIDHVKEVNTHIKKIRELISKAKTFYLGVY